MENGKIFIRIERTKHLELKVLAMKKSITLNQLCLDFILAGLRNIENSIPQIKDLPDEAFNQRLILEMRNRFEATGLIAILKTPEYITEWVMIFDPKIEILPESIVRFETDSIQLMRWPDSVHAPNMMWINIAKSYQILWTKNDSEKNKINERLQEWG